MGKLVEKSTKGSVSVFKSNGCAYRVYYGSMYVLIMYSQTWIFHKREIPDSAEEKRAFAGKLMKYGISLLDYSRNHSTSVLYKICSTWLHLLEIFLPKGRLFPKTRNNALISERVHVYLPRSLIHCSKTPSFVNDFT